MIERPPVTRSSGVVLLFPSPGNQLNALFSFSPPRRRSIAKVAAELDSVPLCVAADDVGMPGAHRAQRLRHDGDESQQRADAGNQFGVWLRIAPSTSIASLPRC